MLSGKFDFSLKVVALGDSGVGKTSLLVRVVRDSWTEETQPTLGVDFMTRVVQTEKHRIQLQLWDTAGHELFRSVTRTYYRGAAGALIIFDLTRPDTLGGAERWITDLCEVARPDVVKILIGNKSDMGDERKVQREEAEQFAEARGMRYFEVSARSGENVQSAIDAIVEQLEQLVLSGAFNFSPVTNEERLQPPEERKCC